MSEKSVGKKLEEKLRYKNKNALEVMDEAEYEKALVFCEDYKKFLDNAKTEREAVKTAVGIAEENGFKPFERNKKYKSGDKVYFCNRGKTVAFAVIGKESIENGLNMVAAHIDSPRLDLKPVPLYEDTDLALFKTHYYGGIKKYQWTVIPLALHGVFVKRDGSIVNVSVGEEDGEPRFVVNDLLPHLSSEQYKRTLNEGIKGEELNLLVGSYPFKDDEVSEKIKLNILNILFEKYGVTEEDFLSAELECVPAFKASDIGFDRSLVGAYGQDDRVCAYPCLRAVLGIDTPKKTALAVLTDKEEIGSVGNTGLNSEFLKYVIKDLCDIDGSEYTVALRNSKCLSADVNSAVDPTFKDAHDLKNASYVNHGIVVTKYCGRGGKSGTSDASAEFVAEIRALLDKNSIVWQTGELGKVDIGGGGTVSVYVASLGADVVDVGVPVLSMHAPFETTGKADVYMCYRTMYEFLK